MTPTISAKPSPWPRRRPSSPSTVHAQRSPTTTARSTKSATWSSVSSTSSSTSGVSRPDTNRLQEPTSPWSNSPPSLSGPGNCQRNLGLHDRQLVLHIGDADDSPGRGGGHAPLPVGANRAGKAHCAIRDLHPDRLRIEEPGVAERVIDVVRDFLGAHMVVFGHRR